LSIAKAATIRLPAVAAARVVVIEVNGVLFWPVAERTSVGPLPLAVTVPPSVRLPEIPLAAAPALTVPPSESEPAAVEAALAVTEPPRVSDPEAVVAPDAAKMMRTSAQVPDADRVGV
jgi:hypothetical protein